MKRIYRIEEDQITFKFEYNPSIISEIKKIEGRKYIYSIKAWTLPINYSSKKQIYNLIVKYDFVEQKNKEEIDVEVKLLNYHSKIRNNLKLFPRDYQNFAIDYLLTNKHVLNGDDIGLGKTMEAIFGCEIENLFPVIVVCPSSVKYHWYNMWKKTNPDREIQVISASDKVISTDKDIYILNYDLLGKKIVEREIEKLVPRYSELFKIKLKCLIFDEIHFIKSHKSVRGKLAKKLAKNVEYIWGLTGTPILNKPVEIVHPLTVLQVFDNVFGSWFSFVHRYCDAKKTRFGLDVSGASHTIELNKILRKNCYFRREKRSVLKELPNIQYNQLNVEISNKREYYIAEKNLIEYIRINYSEIKADAAKQAEFLVLRNTLKQLSGRGKIEEIKKWIDNFLEITSEKLVVFGIHKQVLSLLSKYYNSVLIDGSVSSEQKQIFVDEFKENRERVLFGNINALGVGTDGLQDSCSNMLIIELPERPGDIDQVVGRLERSGQKNSINIYFILSHQTIDVDIWNMLEEKREVTEAVNKGVEVRQRSFQDMFLEKYSKKI